MAKTITEKDVLDYFKLDSKEYGAERVQNTEKWQAKYNEYSKTKKKDDFDSSEWRIFNRKSKETVPISKLKTKNATFNLCAIEGNKGIIIVSKTKFVSGINGQSSSDPENTNLGNYDGSAFSSYGSSYGGSDGLTGQGWFETVAFGPEGHDEKIIQHIQYLKLSLYKECYEFLGVLLSGPEINVNSAIQDNNVPDLTVDKNNTNTNKPISTQLQQVNTQLNNSQSKPLSIPTSQQQILNTRAQKTNIKI